MITFVSIAAKTHGLTYRPKTSPESLDKAFRHDILPGMLKSIHFYIGIGCLSVFGFGLYAIASGNQANHFGLVLLTILNLIFGLGNLFIAYMDER